MTPSKPSPPIPGCHIKLAGLNDLYRVRLGNYRAIYNIEDDRLMVYVLKIGDRKDIIRNITGQVLAALYHRHAIDTIIRRRYPIKVIIGYYYVLIASL